MSKLVALFALLALVQVATALQCYFCLKDDCLKKETEWQKIPCNNAAQTDTVPRCAVIHYKEKSTGKQQTKRSCETVPKDKPNQCTISDAESISCETCTEDYCNAAPAYRVGSAAAVFVCAAAVFLANKVLL